MKRIQNGLLLLILAVYPFGQLFGMVMGRHLLDGALVGLLILRPRLPKWSWGFLGVGALSLVVGWAGNPGMFGISSVLYLLRLVAVVNLAGVARGKKFTRALGLVGLVVLVFGLLQYVIWPDLRAMKAWGWDDHYYRMVSTMMDPGFTGIILVLTGVVMVAKKWKWWLSMLLVVGIGLTFSRASYLAFWAGMGYMAWQRRSKMAVAMGIMLLVVIPLLPKPGGEGVKLARTASIAQRVENYSEGLELFGKNVALGVGYNNVCQAKKTLGLSAGEHSCGGVDNSLLFVLVTTGVIGFLAFVGMGWSLVRESSELFRASVVVVVVHGIFHNTLFYLWVMVWLAILYGAETRAGKKQ